MFVVGRREVELIPVLFIELNLIALEYKKGG